jgi:phosphate acetyltransferase
MLQREVNMISNKTYDEIHIGDSARLTRTMTKRDVDFFAVLSGDMNPTHFSDEYAQMLLERQKLTGHSMWGATLISSLLGNELPGPGTVYQSQQLEFHNAMELGDTIDVLITAKEKIDSEKSIIFDCSVTNQRDDLIISGIAKVKAPHKKAAELDLPVTEMSIHSQKVFHHFIEECLKLEPISVAVAHPCSEYALRGPIDAAREGLIEPILIGPEDKVKELADKHDIDISPYQLINTKHSHDSASQAVALCRKGDTEALMKGSLHTDEILGAVVNRETGLRTGTRLSHVFVMDVPTYPRPLLITDAAINIYPVLEDKIDILKNAIQLAHALKIKNPKVAILSAVETVNPKIPSTLEAAALCKMADRGQISGALIDGPLAFDNAISKEAAMIKGIQSPVAGEADILIAPDLEAGNMLAKQLTYLVEADAAGIVMGARVPIILTSRADSAKARLASCAVAVAFAHAQRSQLNIEG